MQYYYTYKVKKINKTYKNKNFSKTYLYYYW